MAHSLSCDACGAEITDMTNRATVLIYTTAPISDPSLDLCGDCIGGILNDSKVKKASKAARKRNYERRAEQAGVSYEDFVESVNATSLPPEEVSNAENSQP